MASFCGSCSFFWRGVHWVHEASHTRLRLPSESTKDTHPQLCYEERWLPHSRDLASLPETLAWCPLGKHEGCGWEWEASLCWGDENSAEWGQECPGTLKHAVLHYAHYSVGIWPGEATCLAISFWGKSWISSLCLSWSDSHPRWWWKAEASFGPWF